MQLQTLVYPAKSKTSIVEKGICQGDNPIRSTDADRGEVYNDSYQEYEAKPHQFTDEKFVGEKSFRRLKGEVLIEMQIYEAGKKLEGHCKLN